MGINYNYLSTSVLPAPVHIAIVFYGKSGHVGEKCIVEGIDSLGRIVLTGILGVVLFLSTGSGEGTDGLTKKPAKLFEKKMTKTKTYNSRDSHVVTHHTTNLPACGLSTAERTGSPVLHTLWSYVLANS